MNIRPISEEHYERSEPSNLSDSRQSHPSIHLFPPLPRHKRRPRRRSPPTPPPRRGGIDRPEPEKKKKKMVAIRAPKSHRAKRELLKHAPKLVSVPLARCSSVETGKKTLVLHGTKTSAVLNSVLADLFHLKRDNAVRYSKKNENIRPFESGGETSLEFFSLKTDCSLIVVVENLNLAGVDRVFVCTAISPTTVYLMHCALRLKRSGTSIPRMELVEVGPSMDLVVRRHRYPAESLKKEAMKTADHAKKMKNVTKDPVQGKLGKVYIPDQQIAKMSLSNDIKGLKRERREAKKNKEHTKKQKINVE
uniref:Ribosome production factor 2 homolog n=1 Tax=Oryza sativa subsp. japonica TaxID=39947 RepID=Q75IN9_ORYSJ|nr:unknown protein [Oryza sativa Japonica Group]